MTHPTNGDRRPPVSEDAEQAVLAAMLLEQSAIVEVLTRLDETMFYREAHRRIFRALCALFQAGTAVDPLTLANELERAGALQAAGGKDYLGQLLDVVPTAANVAYHAGIVRDRAGRRRLIEFGQRGAALAYDLDTPVDQIVSALSRDLVPLATTRQQEGFQLLKDLLWPWMEALEQRSGPNAHAGRLTGYPELDEKLHGGFQDGELVIIAGVPNSGKTAVALNFLLNAALDAGDACAFVSAEMGREPLIARCCAMVGNIEGVKIRKGALDADGHRRIAQALRTLGQLPFWIDDTAMPDLEDIVAKVRLLKAQHPALRTVAVDFIQLIQARAERGELGESVLRRISYALKGLARDLGLTVLATCQPNDKQIEDRDDKRPTLRDLQGSAGMRQAADLVMMVYRPGQYSKTAGPELELNVPKARALPTFQVTLEWEGAYTRVTSRGRQVVEQNRRALAEAPQPLGPVVA